MARGISLELDEKETAPLSKCNNVIVRYTRNMNVIYGSSKTPEDTRFNRIWEFLIALHCHANFDIMYFSSYR